MADAMPEGAQLSPDGHYWWDEHAGAWQAVQASGSSSSAPAAGDAPAPAARSGTINIELGVVHEEVVSHDDVVAMVQRGGAELPAHEGSGEAYA